MHRSSFLLSFSVVGSLAMGCGSSPDGPAAGGAAGYKPCAATNRLGEFVVALGDGFTSATGSVKEGVVPISIPDEVMKVGECRMLKPRQLFCDPACASGQTCGAEKRCIPFPADKSVGNVTITGLKVSPIVLMPNESFFYTYKGDLPNPGFDDGADISLQASGGQIAAFTGKGAGFAPIVVTSKDILIDRNKAVVATWTPPAKAGAAAVVLTLGIDNHGAGRAKIECEVADNGMYTIPAGMVTALFDMGLSGFPTLGFKRTTASAATVTQGCVQFSVESEQDVDIKVQGITSCNFDEECTAPKKCAADRTCK